jgi:hypothetical protein
MLLPLYLRFLTGIFLVVIFILLERFAEFVVLQNGADLRDNLFPEPCFRNGNSEHVTVNVSTSSHTGIHHCSGVVLDNNASIDRHLPINRATGCCDSGLGYSYTRQELLSLRSNTFHISDDVYNDIKTLGITRRRRGRRAGTHTFRKIKTCHVQRFEKRHDTKELNYRNVNNLRSIPRVKPFANLITHLWNTQSLGNKSTALVDHVLQHDVDLMLITETWFFEHDPVKIGECTPRL